MTSMHSSNNREIKADIDAMAHGIGINADAGAGIDSYVDESSKVKNSKTFVRIKGGDRGADIVQTMDIKNGSNAILNFAKQSKNGTILSYKLMAYQLHPDYTKVISCCHVKPEDILKYDEDVNYYLL